MDGFDFENSTFEELEMINIKLVDFYKTDIVKNGIIDLYGKESYNCILRMMTDNSFTESDVLELINKIRDSYIPNKE